MRVLTACVITVLVATPASAQLRRSIVGPPPPRERIPSIAETADPWPARDARLARDLAEIHDRIDDARDGNALTRREARRLNQENGQIGTLAERYGRDGLSGAERAELETRAHILRDQLTVKRTKALSRK